MSVPPETLTVTCSVCHEPNPTGNKFCGKCGASLDPAIGIVSKYLDENLKTRLDAVIKERFREQTLVETEMAVRVADKISSWGKLFGLYVGVPLVAAVAYLGWLGFDVNQTLKGLQTELKTAQKSSDDASKAAEDAKVKAAVAERSADDLQSKIEKSSLILAQIPQLAASVTQLNDRVGGAGQAQLQALQQHGNAIGVDAFNRPVDATKLRAAGVSFVYARASLGSARPDAAFDATCSNARQAGLLCGGFHFLTRESPSAQAALFLERLKAVKTDLPPAVDFEPSPSGPSATIDDLKAFVVLIQQATGCTPVIYGGHYLDQQVVPPGFDLNSFPRWVAQYASTATGQPTKKLWQFWQFSDGLTIQGLPPMDFNAFNGNEVQLREFAKSTCSRPSR